MFYHASPIAGIECLIPHVSEHSRGIPQVFFSKKRENTLPYLCNAIQKYCRETGFLWDGPWTNWGPYGFSADGTLRLEEYYPDAAADTYRGVSGYIYRAARLPDAAVLPGIPDAFMSGQAVPVLGCEFVADAYAEILKAQREGKITLLRYEELDGRRRERVAHMVNQEYAGAAAHPEYRHFLRGKFGALLQTKTKENTD